ncbi:MAG TPA: rhomboid family intramembrane serine protease [Spirochaetia bacterium]|nr:rhomboid family intramembrane serine protease [Spirochaetia bacterium]
MIPLKDDVPSLHRPYVNYAIIAVNLVVFAAIAGPSLNGTIAAWGVVPASFLNLPVTGMALKLLTATFIHASWLHVLGNMLFLWIFGDNIEDAMGHAGYLVFYFLTGAIALFAFVFLNPQSQIPLVGASGAISGVLGAYFMLYPRAKVWTLLFLFFIFAPVRLPAVLFLGVWFLLQALNESLVYTGGQGGGVAFAAHMGGFVAGMLLMPLFVRRRQIKAV